jgi:hypothetical protein
MSEYVRHCASKRVPADWLKFDELAKASGPVAGPILDGLRDSYEVPWKLVYGTEITLSLDEDLNPARAFEFSDEMATEYHALCPLSNSPAAYTGTLDVILIWEDGTRAMVCDYKSHPAPFEADTFQSILYPFMLFKHLPELESVKFELNFVRYRNCLRSVTWKREDMPEMQAAITRARERQRITHENPDTAPALPCKTCTYCPLAKNLTCPIADWNEYLSFTPTDRLMHLEFMRRMRELHQPILKAYATVEGPVRYSDGNGRIYEYGEQPVPSTRYPLDATTLQVLNEHSAATGDDWLKWNLDIKGTTIKAKLNTKKRALLKEQFEDSVIETGTKPRFAVRTPEGVVPEFNPFSEE